MWRRLSSANFQSERPDCCYEYFSKAGWQLQQRVIEAANWLDHSHRFGATRRTAHRFSAGLL